MCGHCYNPSIRDEIFLTFSFNFVTVLQVSALSLIIGSVSDFLKLKRQSSNVKLIPSVLSSEIACFPYSESTFEKALLTSFIVKFISPELGNFDVLSLTKSRNGLFERDTNSAIKIHGISPLSQNAKSRK